ncbi:MAG: PAS domain S-box protein [Bacteroidetes bacterium]|nr:MAG: PAS domain S-box protein [Bacteroidota bacterium]TAG86303.1 MAG: PAS domain S-box protein [Bacteroidota bacterium]
MQSSTINNILCFFILFIQINFIFAQNADKIKKYEAELNQPNIKDTAKIRILGELSWLNRNNNPEISLKYGREAVKLSDNYPNIDHSKVYTFVGVIYRNLGNYVVALEYFMKANVEAEKYGNKKQLGFAYQSIADILYKQGQLPKSEEYIRKGLEIFKQLDDKEGIAYTYHTWGKIAEAGKKYEQALHYHYQALEIRRPLNVLSAIASTKTQIGILYQRIKKYDRALDYLNEAKEVFVKDKNNSGIVNVYNTLSEIYFDKKEFKLSLEFAEKAVDISLKAKLTDLTQRSYQNLGNVYTEQKEYQKAFEAQKLSMIYRDSLFNKEKQWQSLAMQDQFQQDKQQSEIIKLKSKSAQQSLWFYFSFATIVLLILIMAAVFINLKQKRKFINKIENQSESIAEKNKDIEQANQKVDAMQERLDQSLKMLEKSQEKTDELKSLQKTVWQNANLMMMTVDKKGVLTSFNPTSEKILGYTAEELVNKKTTNLFLDTEQIKNSDNDDEWTYLTKSGEKVQVLVMIDSIKNNKEEIIGHLIIAQNISERKIYETKLKHTEDQFLQIQNIGEVGLWEINFPAQKTKWSEQMFVMYDMPKEGETPTIDEYLKKYTHKDDMMTFIQIIDATKTQKIAEAEVRNFDMNGKPFTLLVKATALLSEKSGKWIGAKGTAMRIHIGEKTIKSIV